MNAAFLFPGQGAQYVGMGKDICEKYEEANKIYENAEKALKDIEKQGLRLVPLCPFVAGYIHKHPEWKRIVMKGIHIQ